MGNWLTFAIIVFGLAFVFVTAAVSDNIFDWRIGAPFLTVIFAMVMVANWFEQKKEIKETA